MLETVLWMTALAGVGGTGAGGILTCGLRRDGERTISLLLSFAAGVMLAVVCGDLLTDALSQRSGVFGLGLTFGGVLMGYGLIGLLNRITAREQPEQRRGLFWAGVVMAAAIALHNLPEGMVIGASFARGTGAGGLAMAVVIGLHNIPEGMAITVPLVSGGMGRFRAAGLAAAAGAPTILGAALGYGLGMLGPVWLALALSFAAGAMLYVVFGELLPESTALWQSEAPALAAVAGILTGLCITAL